ncbi:hypothetical protein DAI22_04g135350 [Oryza sativa Japonica Group]|nr:hypothetical protein DAI22_04g135350 [Oryza sativa Japonica Group]
MEESLNHYFPLKLGVTICSCVFPIPPMPIVLRCSFPLPFGLHEVIKEGNQGFASCHLPVCHYKSCHLRIS